MKNTVPVNDIPDRSHTISLSSVKSFRQRENEQISFSLRRQPGLQRYAKSPPILAGLKIATGKYRF